MTRGPRPLGGNIDDVPQAYELIRQILFDTALRAATVATYRLRVESVEIFCKFENITKQKFFRFLFFRRKQINCQTANSYRCAIAHAQKYNKHLEDGLCWANDSDTRDACKGMLGGRTYTPRGALTRHMYHGLFNTMDKTKVPYTQLEHRCFRLIYEGALRRSEFTTLLCTPIGYINGHPYVTLYRDKRQRPMGIHPCHEHPRLVTPAFVKLFNTLIEGRKPTDLIIDGPLKMVTRLIKIVKGGALLCGWRTDLKYDGIHCLRHGHAVDNCKDPALKDRMNCTQVNANYYARPNESRAQQGRRAKPPVSETDSEKET
jgi:hypothetical protein